ncbi:MAG: Imm61 family immunity protein [Mycobacterium sp.]|uniref:Imm61 family immunity protein n=1 Tax=Mycobacterium sp. TaxID=1785 RepID=UPI002616507B|nr:Imm61 family immunity protein [Mycobacterium sp.]MDI3313436.1 Imm61 family immunity protein [Mycobacterium sp.]
MTERIEISPELQEWARRAGYTLTPECDDGRALFWNAGGEVLFYLGSREDGWFVITRSDRRGPEYFQFAAPSMSTIVKYLFGEFSDTIRSKHGLPILRAPQSRDQVAAGYRIQPRVFDGVERLALIGPDGSLLAVGSSDELTGTADLVDVSLYLGASIDDIKAS